MLYSGLIDPWFCRSRKFFALFQFSPKFLISHSLTDSDCRLIESERLAKENTFPSSKRWGSWSFSWERFQIVIHLFSSRLWNTRAANQHRWQQRLRWRGSTRWVLELERRWARWVFSPNPGNVSFVKSDQHYELFCFCTWSNVKITKCQMKCLKHPPCTPCTSPTPRWKMCPWRKPTWARTMPPPQRQTLHSPAR